MRTVPLSLALLASAFTGAVAASAVALFFRPSYPASVIQNTQPSPPEYSRLTNASLIDTDHNHQLLDLEQRLHTLEERLDALVETPVRTPVASPPKELSFQEETERRHKLIDSFPFSPDSDKDPIPTSYLADAFDALALQRDTQIHPSVLAKLYQAGFTTSGLRQFEDDLKGLSHITAHLPLPSEAQVDMVRAIEVYNTRFMENHNLSADELLALPQQNPSLFILYRTGKWNGVKEWFQQNPPGVGYEQVQRAVNYMNSPIGHQHLEQAITEGVQKVSQPK